MTNGVKEGLSGLQVESSVAPRRRYKKYTTGTYIGLIAYAIQESPDKMLTFKQIMKKLEPYVFGDKKGIENNIRVCLSSNRCFAKVPVDPDYPNPKKNFWKVDENGITPKMFRRHFKYLINIFPGLSIQTQQVDGREDNSSAPEALTPALFQQKVVNWPQRKDLVYLQDLSSDILCLHLSHITLFSSAILQCTILDMSAGEQPE